jgi:hypothetical protein
MTLTYFPSRRKLPESQAGVDNCGQSDDNFIGQQFPRFVGNVVWPGCFFHFEKFDDLSDLRGRSWCNDCFVLCRQNVFDFFVKFPRCDPGQRRRCLPVLQFQTIRERLRFFIVRQNEFAHSVNRWQWFFVGAERSRHSPNRVVLRGEGFEFSFSSIIPMIDERVLDFVDEAVRRRLRQFDEPNVWQDFLHQ